MRTTVTTREFDVSGNCIKETVTELEPGDPMPEPSTQVTCGGYYGFHLCEGRLGHTGAHVPDSQVPR